ncbi:MAG TPA: UDP-N-acetylmuramate dehydrogenase [Firmicutes bacterium]|nr:UDP-N-acetylmuramate dehydrogenase [Bacillota bacterium]
MDWKKKLSNILHTSPLLEEPMCRHTSLGVGGPAECLVYPETLGELAEVLLLAKQYQLPFFVLGSGTNLLVRDGGIKGIVLSLSSLCSSYQFEGYSILAGAAVSLPFLVKRSTEQGLGGLEFAAGIPGSMGGALYMNAGAHGFSIGELVLEVETMDYDGNLKRRSRRELEFSYRSSTFQQEKAIILSGLFQLAPGDRLALKDQVQKNLRKRRSRQPHYPSAGSVFRNPPGLAAGKLLDEVGVKGLTAGGAMISQEHANFIVNMQDARASDILFLIESAQEKVRTVFNIDLELEIRVVGENSRE